MYLASSRIAAVLAMCFATIALAGCSSKKPEAMWGEHWHCHGKQILQYHLLWTGSDGYARMPGTGQRLEGAELRRYARGATERMEFASELVKALRHKKMELPFGDNVRLFVFAHGGLNSIDLSYRRLHQFFEGPPPATDSRSASINLRAELKQLLSDSGHARRQQLERLHDLQADEILPEMEFLVEYYARIIETGYPLYMSWDSSAGSTIAENVLRMRNGRHVGPIVGGLTSPFVFFGRIVEGTIKLPVTGFTMLLDDFNSTRDENQAVHLNSELVGAAAIHRAIQQERRHFGDSTINVTGIEDLSTSSEGILTTTADFFGYTLALPFRVASLPILGGLGADAWNNMDRRTTMVFDSALQQNPAAARGQDAALSLLTHNGRQSTPGKAQFVQRITFDERTEADGGAPDFPQEIHYDLLGYCWDSSLELRPNPTSTTMMTYIPEVTDPENRFDKRLWVLFGNEFALYKMLSQAEYAQSGDLESAGAITTYVDELIRNLANDGHSLPEHGWWPQALDTYALYEQREFANICAIHVDYAFLEESMTLFRQLISGKPIRHPEGSPSKARAEAWLKRMKDPAGGPQDPLEYLVGELQSLDTDARLQLARTCTPLGDNLSKEYAALDFEIKSLSADVRAVTDRLAKSAKMRESIRAMMSSPTRFALRVDLIGHSMGTMVMNELLRRYPYRSFDNIVYMGAACSAEDFQSAVVPYLQRNREAKFYHLMLHPSRELRERSFGPFAPRGSLLVWIDNYFENALTIQGRTFGRYVTALKTVHLVPLDVRHRIFYKVFRYDAKGLDCESSAEANIAEGNPVTHGGFTLCDFWREDWWEH